MSKKAKCARCGLCRLLYRVHLSGPQGKKGWYEYVCQECREDIDTAAPHALCGMCGQPRILEAEVICDPYEDAVAGKGRTVPICGDCAQTMEEV